MNRNFFSRMTLSLRRSPVATGTIAFILVYAIALVCNAATLTPSETPRFKIKRLTENGGRVAWYTGLAHDLIAYDAIIDKSTAATEVYVMRPDGSGVRCISCSMIFPKGGGFVGQPAWHPDGKHLVIQVENANSKHTRFNHMSWGIDADLWLISLDGEPARRIWVSPPGCAALHPHFSDDGRLLVFSERSPTKKVTSRLFHPWSAIGGQNPWDGWSMHVATVDTSASDNGILSNHRSLTPNGGGFYETHSISNKGRIVYSFTRDGAPYVDDIYETDIDTPRTLPLIVNSATWDEHGAFSPNGRKLAFISSRADPKWRAPHSYPDTLTTELFLRSDDGLIHQLTSFNKETEGGKRCLVSDFDWDRYGRRIVFQVAPVYESGKSEPPEIWLLEFSVLDSSTK